jgi:urease accessory protein
VTLRASSTPASLPDEFAVHDRPIDGGLAVGSPGKVGVLELSLAQSGGVTRVVHHYQRAPLHAYRPIHLDQNLPGMAFVFVQQFGDGYVDGDRCRIDLDCGPGSGVHVTTQAATNLYRSQRNFATQLVHLRVGPGAILEYLPDAVVPFRGARFFQRTCITVDVDGTAIVGELLLPGRVARGELHAYDLYWAETEARRPDGALLFADLIRLSPAEGHGVRSLALLGGRDVLATLYIVSQRRRAVEIVELLREAACGEGVLAGVSELPNDSGVSVRLLGLTSKSVRAALTSVWDAARLALLGAPAPDLRKG